jgi:hypothetical protein
MVFFFLKRPKKEDATYSVDVRSSSYTMSVCMLWSVKMVVKMNEGSEAKHMRHE